MSNIVGEGFAREIREQVDTRQKIYGTINRTNEQLQYLNANTGWVRLASSVNTNAQIRDFPADLRSNELAKKYVLFGGVSGVQGTNFNNLRDAFNTEAYGIGGLEFGIKPMPGIKSAQIKTLTIGSLKEATIQITANNRTQFDIIDILYLRLGFIMLLEWGHASYFPNSGDFVDDNPFGIYPSFLEGKLKYNKILDTIQDNRLKSNGNYDAIAGKVVNFNWKYNRDGTYDITLILRSLGDVIESLKANILLGDGEGKLQTTGVPLQSAANTTNPTFSYNPPGTKQESTQIPLKPLETIKPIKISNEIDRLFFNLKKEINNLPINSQTDNGMRVNYSNNQVNSFSQAYSNTEDNQYYIRLGYFLDWIEENLIPYVDNDTNNRLIRFDTNPETNLIYLDAYQISADPRVCTFKRTFETGYGTQTFSESAEEFEIKKGTTFSYGKIMNAYFNMDYISNTIANLISADTGEVSILDLVRNLCTRWNQVTGHVNRLDIRIDPDTNICKIIDESSIPGKDKTILLNNLNIPVETARFLTYQSFPNTGSTFLKDINFTTQIPHNFSTLITIGSTAQGYVLGADATALSRMNAGLTDRTKENISSPGSKDRENLTLEEKYKEPLAAYEEFKRKLSFFENSGTSDKPEWDEIFINNFSSLQTQLIEYRQASASRGSASTDASSPNMGFLPFNMSLTMDGLSGMKVYQKFEMDTDFLPSNYPTSLEFIIKGITHTIQNNEWITNIESFAIPANPFGTELGKIVQGQRAQSKIVQQQSTPKNLISDTSKFNQASIQRTITFFKSQGFPDTSVASIVGNLLVESGLNTNALGDNGTAYGIAQWRGIRQAGLKKRYPKDYTSLDSQLKYIIDELNGIKYPNGRTSNFSAVLKTLKSTIITVEGATAIWDNNYEISNGQSLEQRKIYAKDIYNKIKNRIFK